MKKDRGETDTEERDGERARCPFPRDVFSDGLALQKQKERIRRLLCLHPI